MRVEFAVQAKGRDLERYLGPAWAGQLDPFPPRQPPEGTVREAALVIPRKRGVLRIVEFESHLNAYRSLRLSPAEVRAILTDWPFGSGPEVVEFRVWPGKKELAPLLPLFPRIPQDPTHYRDRGSAYHFVNPPWVGYIRYTSRRFLLCLARDAASIQEAICFE
jgi:hypothetical protein